MSRDRAMRRVLVTGATGLIGTQVSRRMAREGVQVRALARDAERARPIADPAIEIAVGDVTAPASLRAALEGVDTVIHCAALVAPAQLPAAEFARVNVEGTRHVLAACERSRSVRRIVHVSSVGVIGHVPAGEVASESAATRPADAYERTKLEAERVVHAAIANGAPVVIARPAWVYGPTARGTRKLFGLIARRRLLLVGRADNRRHPVWIDDLVLGLLRCATVAGIEGRTYHLAGPEILTAKSLCTIVAETIGTSIPRVRVPFWLAAATASIVERAARPLRIRPPIDTRRVDFFLRDQAYSIRKAADELEWVPRLDFRSGAAETWKAWQAAGSWRAE